MHPVNLEAAEAVLEEVVEVLEAVVVAVEVVEVAHKPINPEIANTVVDIISSSLNTQEVAMIHMVNNSSSNTLNMARKTLIMPRIIMVKRLTIKRLILTISNSNKQHRKQHTEK